MAGKDKRRVRKQARREPAAKSREQPRQQRCHARKRRPQR